MLVKARTRQKYIFRNLCIPIKKGLPTQVQTCFFVPLNWKPKRHIWLYHKAVILPVRINFFFFFSCCQVSQQSVTWKDNQNRLEENNLTYVLLDVLFDIIKSVPLLVVTISFIQKWIKCRSSVNCLGCCVMLQLSLLFRINFCAAQTLSGPFVVIFLRWHVPMAGLPWRKYKLLLLLECGNKWSAVAPPWAVICCCWYTECGRQHSSCHSQLWWLSRRTVLPRRRRLWYT